MRNLDYMLAACSLVLRIVLAVLLVCHHLWTCFQRSSNFSKRKSRMLQGQLRKNHQQSHMSTPTLKQPETRAEGKASKQHLDRPSGPDRKDAFFARFLGSHPVLPRIVDCWPVTLFWIAELDCRISYIRWSVGLVDRAVRLGMQVPASDGLYSTQ